MADDHDGDDDITPPRGVRRIDPVEPPPRLDEPVFRIATRPDGVIALDGPASDVERFVERIQAVVGSPRFAQSVQTASVLGASIDAIPGVGEGPTPTVMQVGRRALDLLRVNGLLGPVDGLFRATGDQVRNSTAAIDWVPLPSGADVIQLQTAAVGVALQASLKSLADAVQRVENRVDELRDLVRSGQVGEVLGHHRVIRERLAMIDDPDGNGLGETDWAAVAHLHPHIVAGLERTRFFIRSRMGATEPGRMVRSRVDAAERLVDADLADALGLLATCERNLVGWQRLRLDRVVRNEPSHLDAVIVDMESSLALHRVEDQSLVDELVATIDELMEPTGLEGLALLQRRKLIRHVEQIHEATATFARQRDLDLPDVTNGDLPGFRQSTGYVAERTRSGGRWAIDRIRRRNDDGPLALDAAAPPPPDPPPPDPMARSPHD